MTDQTRPLADGELTIVELARLAATVAPREAEALRGVAAGMDHREIGAAMGVAPATVHRHLEISRRKLRARNSFHAAMRYMHIVWLRERGNRTTLADRYQEAIRALLDFAVTLGAIQQDIGAHGQALHTAMLQLTASRLGTPDPRQKGGPDAA